MGDPGGAPCAIGLARGGISAGSVEGRSPLAADWEGRSGCDALPSPLNRRKHPSGLLRLRPLGLSEPPPIASSVSLPAVGYSSTGGGILCTRNGWCIVAGSA